MNRPPKIEFIHTGVSVDLCDILSYKQATNTYRWGKILSALSRHRDRSEFILKELRQLIDAGKQILFISDRLDLLDWISSKLLVSPVPNFARISGDTLGKQRTEYLLRFGNKKLQVLLCSNVVEHLAVHELDFDYLFLATPTTHSRFGKRYKLVLGQKTPPIIRDYVDDVEWIRSTTKKRMQTAYTKGWDITVKQPPGEKDMANSHENKPARCGRIGGPVTIENGVCPECGWRKEEEPSPPPFHRVRTASRIPEQYIVVDGAGQSNFGPGNDPWETTAYDIALQEGGIENCNIVKYTSVIPPEARMINLGKARREGLFHHGMVLECIMAQVDGNEGQHICAGVGTFDVHDEHNKLVGGFAVEYEGVGSPQKARKMLEKSMNGLFSRRYKMSTASGMVAYRMRNKEFHIRDLVVDDKYGTVLVGLCFVSFTVPTF